MHPFESSLNLSHDKTNPHHRLMQVEQSAKSYERREYIEALEPTPAPARSPLGPEGIVRFWSGLLF